MKERSIIEMDNESIANVERSFQNDSAGGSSRFGGGLIVLLYVENMKVCCKTQ